MFKSYFRSSLLIVGLLAVGIGCGTKHEKAADKMVSLMDEFADRLAKIKTNANLVDAKPDLEKITAKMSDQAKAMKDLGEPTGEEKTKLEQEYKPKVEKASARIKDEMTRIGKDLGPGASMGLMGSMMGGFGAGQMP